MEIIQIEKDKIKQKINHLEKRKRYWASRHNKNDTVKTDIILEDIRREIDDYQEFLQELI